MPRRSLWIILAVVIVSLACYERADRNPYGRWFSEVLETIDRYYLEPVDDQRLFEGALNGMVRKLDDYSAFLPRSEAPQFQESLDQQYGGIGIEVIEGPQQGVTIKSPIIGTPAFKAGLKVGDTIVAVDGKKIAGVSLRELVKLLRGKPGEAVSLTIRRAGDNEPLDFKLVRALIKMDSVTGYQRDADGAWDFMLPGDDRLGYTRIDVFGEATVSEFEVALKALATKNCRGLVIDLRNNPGGLLQAAERICDLFVPAGALIVSTRGRDARERNRYLASGSGPYQTLPLVVLVNDKSASAAEIVAACLQDHHRATVVGERTWGKGTVQNVIPLEGGKSLLKLTIASYWRPSGKNIHRSSTSQATDDWGVQPDPGCEVEPENQPAAATSDAGKATTNPLADQPAEAATAPVPSDPKSRFERDRQLRRAIEVLEEKLAPPAAAKPNAA